MTSEQRFVGGKGARMQLLKERAFQKERLAVAKDVYGRTAFNMFGMLK